MNAIAKTEEPTRLPAVTTLLEILDRAIAHGASTETLARLMDLQERHEKNQARRAFDEAMASAKAKIPVIVKNRQVGFESKKAGAARTDYRHEDMAEIARTIDPILAEFGLSYRFRTSSEVNAPISVTCIVSHRDGHSEENTLRAPRDDSGNKNQIQQIGSTITYLQRYTLKAALGLAAAADDDARAAGGEEKPAATIAEDQVREINALSAAIEAPLEKVLEYVGAASVAEMNQDQYERAKQALGVRQSQRAKS